MNKTFLYYTFLTIYKDKKKHISIVIISTILIFLLSSTLFISSSIKNTLLNTLNNQADFIVQKVIAGERVNAPLKWEEKLLNIYGIESVTPRVYGRYYFNDKLNYALIIGVDFLDDNSNKNISKIIDNLNLKKFLSKNNMIIGNGVKEFLEKSFYDKSYTFLTPKGKFIKFNIYKVLPKSSNFVSNNLIIMPIDKAKEILGLKKDEVSDFALNIPNNKEWNNIYDKISSLYFNILVISKNEVKKAYENLYNYKGGFFLSIFILTLITFTLILYYRYTIIYFSEKKDIGLLRAIGWSINSIIKFKLIESLITALIAYILGVTLSYIYVFIYNAPLLKDIFLGNANLNFFIKFNPILDFRVLASIFIIFVIPYIASVIIPVWKISTTNPKEAMK